MVSGITGNFDHDTLGKMRDNGIRPTGDKNADMKTLMDTEKNNGVSGSNNCSSSSGSSCNKSNSSSNSADQSQDPMEKMILGLMKMFGIKPSGDKGADMKKLMEKMSGQSGDSSSSSGFTAMA